MGVAQRLKDLREAAGLSQAELARETGLTRKSIINYENGYREPNSKAMAALERYFHVTIQAGCANCKSGGAAGVHQLYP